MNKVKRTTKSDYGEPVSVEECRKIHLKMLGSLADFCEDNNLQYYLSGGTLLGAVRHQGFIPWDDDMDLMMPREDYIQLIQHFSSDRYILSCCEKDPEYYSPNARVWDATTILHWDTIEEKEIGAFIDIFPIDGFPTSRLLTDLHLIRLRVLVAKKNVAKKIVFPKGERYHYSKIVLKHLLRKTGNYYANHINRLAQKYKFSSCDYVGVKTTSPHLFREKNSKDIIRETVMLPFENLILPAPCGYDVYLSHLYGNDYMCLPSPEKQRSDHEFKIYWRTNKSEDV